MDPRKGISLKEKMEIIEKFENGVPIKTLMAEYHVARSTIYQIKSMKQTILESISNYDLSTTDRKRLCLTKLFQLEQALYKWVLLQQQKIPVTESMIKERALFLKQQMMLTTECTFSNDWLKSFKKKFQIQTVEDSCKCLFEAESVDGVQSVQFSSESIIDQSEPPSSCLGPGGFMDDSTDDSFATLMNFDAFNDYWDGTFVQY